jgi:hypothetical protein
MSLEMRSRWRTRRDTNQPGRSPAPGERRQKKATRKGANLQYRKYGEKRAGRTMSSRSTAIVSETGEPRPKEP